MLKTLGIAFIMSGILFLFLPEKDSTGIECNESTGGSINVSSYKSGKDKKFYIPAKGSVICSITKN